MNDPARRKLGLILTVVFAIALLMGPGPGINLVNDARPDPVFGFPRIYLWGLLWYAVEVTCVVLAYLFVWKKDDEAS